MIPDQCEQQVVGLVEDDPIMGQSLVQRLTLEHLTVKWWQSGQEAEIAIPGSQCAAIICDMRLPDFDGETLFRKAMRVPDAPPFLFITGHSNIDQAVRLMRDGAADYVTKPFEMDAFLARLNELMRPQIDRSAPALGVAPCMREIEKLLFRVARISSTVLITGETGTGKEVAARFLHGMSEAASRPFMAVNCAAIPSELLESELFGHEKGAFSGAIRRHLGYVERAGDGILFLDEIGEMRVDLQAKLLRLIEDRSFHRIGGERPLPFCGRLITATNADLSKRVETGQFRKDLYYRINVVTVSMPALRERHEDIPWLMHQFLNELVGRVDTPVRAISALALEAAFCHPWPGNVRELRNRMERAISLGLGSWIMPGDLFPDCSYEPKPSEGLGLLEDVREHAEKRHILRALEATRGEIVTAAKLLGIGRTTLWEKMRRLGIRPEGTA